MTDVELAERRRIAIIDGDRSYELLVPLDATMTQTLLSLGLRAEVGRDVLIGRNGREIAPLSLAEELNDGAVLTLVDLAQRVARQRRRRASTTTTPDAAGAWWLVAALSIVLSAIALLTPTAFDHTTRVVVATLAGLGVIGTASFFAARATSPRPGSHPALIALLLLAFAAGATPIPALPAATAMLAVFSGAIAASLVAAMIGLIARPPALRAEANVSAAVLLLLSAVWGVALLLHLDITAPAAVTVGLAPVVLRVLLSSIGDVPPGIFIDHERYQSTRWSVRQSMPEEVHSIAASDARTLVARSTGRLIAGTFVVCAAASLAAPVALASFDGSDPLVLAGRIALAASVALALVLGARRFSLPALRWLPRATAGIILVVAALSVMQGAEPLAVSIVALGCLVVAAVSALASIPAARGAQSLGWSRFGDVIEWIAIALSLPAGLLAANIVDTLRGMMGA